MVTFISSLKWDVRCDWLYRRRPIESLPCDYIKIPYLYTAFISTHLFYAQFQFGDHKKKKKSITHKKCFCTWLWWKWWHIKHLIFTVHRCASSIVHRAFLSFFMSLTITWNPSTREVKTNKTCVGAVSVRSLSHPDRGPCWMSTPSTHRSGTQQAKCESWYLYSM